MYCLALMKGIYHHYLTTVVVLLQILMSVMTGMVNVKRLVLMKKVVTDVLAPAASP